MTNSILSLYRVFFTDDNHCLWALMRDGRLVFMKKIPSFATFSSDHTLVTGVEMESTYTHFLQVQANFQMQKPDLVMKYAGYCYYPSLWNTPHAQIAFLRADLLNPKSTGDMFVFRKARTKFHLVDSFTAAMFPPFFSKSGALYYINTSFTLTKRLMKTDEEIFKPVSYFALSPSETEFAVYTNEMIRWMDFKIGQLRQFIAFDVTALGFDETGDILFFATHKQGRTGLYQYDKNTQEITLVLNHPDKITSISY